MGGNNNYCSLSWLFCSTNLHVNLGVINMEIVHQFLTILTSVMTIVVTCIWLMLWAAVVKRQGALMERIQVLEYETLTLNTKIQRLSIK